MIIMKTEGRADVMIRSGWSNHTVHGVVHGVYLCYEDRKVDRPNTYTCRCTTDHLSLVHIDDFLLWYYQSVDM